MNNTTLTKNRKKSNYGEIPGMFQIALVYACQGKLSTEQCARWLDWADRNGIDVDAIPRFPWQKTTLAEARERIAKQRARRAA